MKYLIILCLAFIISAPAQAISMKDWKDGRAGITDEIKAAVDRGADPLDIAALWVKHGNYNYQIGSELGQAKRSYGKAVKIHEQAGTPVKIDYGLALVSLGKTHMVHDKKTARRYFDQAMPILQTELDADHHIFLILEQLYAHINGVTKGPRVDEDGPARIIFQPNKRFPVAARTVGVDAKVCLNFTIEADGTVSNAEVIETILEPPHSSYSKTLTKAVVRREYRREALRAIKKAKFQPAVVDGNAIAQDDQRTCLGWVIAYQ